MIFFYKNILLFAVLIFGISFFFTFLINAILLKFSKNLGIRNHPQEEIRWSSSSKPAIGGISFYVIFLITFILLTIVNNSFSLHVSNLKIIGILFVCSIAFVMGLSDDAYNTRPLIKFIVQVLCGLILYFTRTKITIFPSETLNFSFTIFWVVGLMNSINMLDNMDGIATIVSIVIVFFIVLLHLNLNLIFSPISMMSLGLLGALFGFLIYNWHPAEMYMGDSGSQFIGIFLAIVGIDMCWDSVSFNSSAWYTQNVIVVNSVIVSTIFILPIVDTTTVFINRILSGRSPFIGGRDHTNHYLHFKGMTEKRIAVLYFFIQFVGLFLGLNMILNYQTYWLWLSVSFFLTVFLSLYLNTVIKKK
ncbi:MAG: glycosyltransferase family 4 protein [Bacteroidota bacterium]